MIKYVMLQISIYNMCCHCHSSEISQTRDELMYAIKSTGSVFIFWPQGLTFEAYLGYFQSTTHSKE